MSTRDLSWRDGLLELWSDLEVEVDAPLSRRTTFGIGGPADLLVTAHDDDTVQRVLQGVELSAQPVFVLGGGSNLLVGDGGIRGVVLTLAGGLAELHIEDGGQRLVVGCGCTYPRLTRTALDLGWPGAVGWMGTPGQVGGAVIMNAGSRFGEIGDDVATVEAVAATGPVAFDHDACAFGYRTSMFQQRGVGGARVDASISSVDQQVSRLVLTRVILKCDKSSTENARELDATAKDLLARRHRSQPKLRSAGSLFKNPPGDAAGRLIEAAGLKGFTMGHAQVSPVHANFVVNLGGASARDVVAVADHVQATVQAHSGVTLEWEVRRVGDFSTPAAAGALA